MNTTASKHTNFNVEFKTEIFRRCGRTRSGTAPIFRPTQPELWDSFASASTGAFEKTYKNMFT